MTLNLRRGTAADAGAAGDICYRAFKAIAEAHDFAPDFPDPAAATGLIARLIDSDAVFDIVAEVDGKIAGSNFLDEGDPISGVGPITVDPAVQDAGVGRALMQAVLQRSGERGFAGTRLVQAGYHCRSLVLYLKLGFEAREHLSCVQGDAIGKSMPGYAVRAATMDDLAACNHLCFRVHGHARGSALAGAIAAGMARVVERAGRVTGYAAPIAFFGHAVGEANDDLKALIADAPSFPGAGFLVPTRNSDLLRWCLREGLRVVQTMTLMSIGLYNEPDGAWLPSVLY